MIRIKVLILENLIIINYIYVLYRYFLSNINKRLSKIT